MNRTGTDSAPHTTPPAVTVVVPVLNEAPSLRQLVSELQSGVSPHAAATQIIFVDDGSIDDSWQTICQLAEQHPEVSGIRLRRNFGKAAALTAGMQQATGSLILMLDADLQDDPSEFRGMLQKIQSGFDVINGWKQLRLDPWHKVYPSRVFNWLVGRMTGLKLHDHNCGLKLFRREVAEEVHIYGELHRFIPVLAHARGFKVTEVAVHHRPRQFGVSKYGVRRFLRGLLDLLTVTFLTSFRRRPLHAIGGAGLLLLAIGTLGLTYLAAVWLLIRSGALPVGSIGNRPLLAYSVASVLLGGQILSLGLLAELIVAFTGRSEETYSVRERTSH
ncbi:MAG: glycosyltransferase family 2 protein [Planctomyces sp.]|nr:glycosyltransferase [Planctomycetaceae bacterium]HBC61664.1 glycosyltransferase [Planctomycetaceae bacterium]